jgi:hypothetical protein
VIRKMALVLISLLLRQFFRRRSWNFVAQVGASRLWIAEQEVTPHSLAD